MRLPPTINDDDGEAEKDLRNSIYHLSTSCPSPPVPRILLSH